MYEKRKMKPAEPVPRREEEGVREKDGGRILLRYIVSMMYVSQ
jgi:hypothetical protein